jgi:hypothetical protein
MAKTKRKPTSKPKTKSRFVVAKAAPKTSSSAGSWKVPKPVKRDNHLTEFLGRLWALFGAPPGDNGKGFEYWLHDTDTGEDLQAYAGASGPSFGNARGKRDASIDALEALLNKTKPVDCRATVDYGASEIGIAKGKHFYNYDGPMDDSFAD